jgi:ribosomal protein L40E
MKRLGSFKLDERPSAVRKICGECGGMNPIEALACWKCKEKFVAEQTQIVTDRSDAVGAARRKRTLLLQLPPD